MIIEVETQLYFGHHTYKGHFEFFHGYWILNKSRAQVFTICELTVFYFGKYKHNSHLLSNR